MTAPRPGLGDRWLAGEPLDGIRFGPRAAIEIATGSREGQRGHVALLLGVAPEPFYLVALDDGSELRIRQSALRAGA